MAFGFPARFTETRTFKLPPDELVSVVKSALENLGWAPYELLPGNEFHKWLRTSPLTHGEEFRARILPEGAIQAESECVKFGFLPQIFDFGVNRANVRAFFAQIEQQVK